MNVFSAHHSFEGMLFFISIETKFNPFGSMKFFAVESCVKEISSDVIDSETDSFPITINRNQFSDELGFVKTVKLTFNLSAFACKVHASHGGQTV